MDRLRRAVEKASRNAENQLQPVIDILAQGVLDESALDRMFQSQG